MPQVLGGTPLHRAALRGRTAVVALLLATPGVDPLALTTAVKVIHDPEASQCIVTPPRVPRAAGSPVQGCCRTPLDFAEQDAQTSASEVKAALALLRADPRVARSIEKAVPDAT